MKLVVGKDRGREKFLGKKYSGFFLKYDFLLSGYIEGKLCF